MTFKELNFEPHPLAPVFDQHALVEFPNGYGVSVVNGKSAYCDADTYEVAIMKDGSCCYKTPLTDDVLSYQTPEDIDKILKTVESYEKNQY